MTQPEARLQRKIQDAIRLEGHFVFKVHGSEMMMSGLPDLIVCARGLFIGLEVKVPGKLSNTSVRQELVASRIRKADGAAFTVASVAAALDAIDSVLTKAGIVL